MFKVVVTIKYSRCAFEYIMIHAKSKTLFSTVINETVIYYIILTGKSDKPVMNFKKYLQRLIYKVFRQMEVKSGHYPCH